VITTNFKINSLELLKSKTPDLDFLTLGSQPQHHL